MQKNSTTARNSQQAIYQPFPVARLTRRRPSGVAYALLAVSCVMMQQPLYLCISLSLTVSAAVSVRFSCPFAALVCPCARVCVCVPSIARTCTGGKDSRTARQMMWRLSVCTSCTANSLGKKQQVLPQYSNNCSNTAHSFRKSFAPFPLLHKTHVHRTGGSSSAAAGVSPYISSWKDKQNGTCFRRTANAAPTDIPEGTSTPRSKQALKKATSRSRGPRQHEGQCLKVSLKVLLSLSSLSPVGVLILLLRLFRLLLLL